MGMNGWKISTKSEPCPVCGGGVNYCRVSPDGTTCLCGHMETGCIIRKDGSKYTAKDSMGWMHSLVKRNGKKNGNGHKPKKIIVESKLSITECRKLQKQFTNDLTDDLLKQASESLGVSIAALREYNIGYDWNTGCYSFPMTNGHKQPIGFRLRSRLPDAEGQYRKKCVIGSCNGLFLPNGYESFPSPDMCDAQPLLLLVPEGPTSSAACFDLGFRAIGRPNNTGGRDYVRDLLKEDPPRLRQNVVVIADNDPVHWSKDGIPFVPGSEGALALADYVLEMCATLRVVKMPKGTKDVRAWILSGGGAATIETLIAEAKQLTRRDLDEKIAEMSRWKSLGQIDWKKRNEKVGAN